MGEKYIRKLVKKHQTNCPFTLADQLNIEVWFLDMPDEVRGYFYRVLKRSYIAINSNCSEEWQRFTCAHELGHHHYDKGMGYYFIEKNTLCNPGKYERRANRFAVNLLTYGSEIRENESVYDYYKRNTIPLEIVNNI